MILIDSIKQSIARYCAYQERSQKEVIQKLREIGCNQDETGYYIVWLIEENFINEERFASAYVRGKFNQKGWGKQKILRGLNKHDVSEYIMRTALSEISDHDYNSKAQKLIEKKINSLGSSNMTYQMSQKVFRYMYQKGYESSIINQILKNYLDK